jgi:hypothetical protein
MDEEELFMPEFLLGESEWPAMPEPHRAFLVGAIPRLRDSSQLCGLAAGGSLVSSRLDRFSDLDLVVVTAEASSPLGRSERMEIAARLGTLLAAFTGDHVHEPRLLICLYGSPLLHVDLKFLPASQLNPRVEDPIVFWDRDGDVRRALAAGTAAYPLPDLQWIEDRFWVWVHYGATKIGRGELLEAVDVLAALRHLVLGPLALQRGGRRPDGVRRIEELSRDVVSDLVSTVAACDAASCWRALSKAIAVYREARPRLAPPAFVLRSTAEAASVAYLEAIGRTLGPASNVLPAPR